MTATITRLIFEDDGQDLIEYGLLAALISVAATVTLLIVGPEVKELYSAVYTRFKSATDTFTP